MNKKLICTLMAGTLLVGTVTGCGSSSEGDSSAKGTELELFSSKAENKDILQKLVDKLIREQSASGQRKTQLTIF